MKTSDLKKRIIERVELMDEDQLREVLLYIEKILEMKTSEPALGYSTKEWDLLPSWQQKRIEKANASLDQEEGDLHKDVVKKIKTKYGF